MCNLYSVTKGQQAIREAFQTMVDRTGNLPPLPAIFPDQMAPVVRSGPEGRSWRCCGGGSRRRRACRAAGW